MEPNQSLLGSPSRAHAPAEAGQSRPAAVATQPPPAGPAVAFRLARTAVGLILQPVLWVLGFAATLWCLGLVQRCGWLFVSDAAPIHAQSSGGLAAWICPMMCTPQQSVPGRCPVCAMELVPAGAAEVAGDGRSVVLDAAARRIANIQVAAVRYAQQVQKIRAIGQLAWDEGTRRTLSARVDGRIEKLFADYTGVEVASGDRLAVVYSPRLYAAQVELLLAAERRAVQNSVNSSASLPPATGLYDSSRQRLIELGMTEDQILQLEQAGRANSRLELNAPISGTVIEKLAVEGQYVREGDVIFQLADLSTVWLMLQLFPEDAARVRFGQRVEVSLQSLPGETFEGRVAFVSPQVDPQTRTATVRVVLGNGDRRLRVGDFASAEIQAVGPGPSGLVYDADLAKRWISRRHPHVIHDSPGQCPICHEPLVSARELGYTDDPAHSEQAVYIPRDALLMAGDSSVVYVETDPGRFELRRVTAGASSGNEIAIHEGLAEGDQVAVKGNFLIDSQMQLAGNPSLIDPTRVIPAETSELSPSLVATLNRLPAEDRDLALKQRTCPVANMPLGSMGVPIRVMVGDVSVFICCEGCRKPLLRNPADYLAKQPTALPEIAVVPANAAGNPLDNSQSPHGAQP